MRWLMAHSKHANALEIIFNRITKFSTCYLSLIVHLDDAHDLFYKFLSRLWQRRMTFFVRMAIFLFFPLFSCLDPGGESRRFSQAVRDGRSREAVSRLLLVWPTAARFPSSSADRSSFRKTPAGGKNDRLDFLGICTCRVSNKRNAMNTVEIVK